MPSFSGSQLHIGQLIVTAASGNKPDVLVDHHFDGCTILGPAVLAPIERTEFSSSGFIGDIDAVLWEVPIGRPGVIGAIGLIACSFVRCQFVGIGMAGPPSFIERMRSEFTRDAAPAWPPAEASHSTATGA